MRAPTLFPDEAFIAAGAYHDVVGQHIREVRVIEARHGGPNFQGGVQPVRGARLQHCIVGCSRRDYGSFRHLP